MPTARSQPLLPPPDRPAAAISEEPPYSVCNEVRCFLTQGIPLCVASIVSSGVPAIVTTIVAGHTSESATLQASLGYARTFYVLAGSMPLGCLCSYFGACIPGCIGAKRHDRIARYLWRSMLWTYSFLIPSFALLCFAAPVLVAIGAPPTNAAQAATYCRLMLITTALQVVATHLTTLMNNLGYMRVTAASSLVTGLGVDVGLSFLLVLHLDLGVTGAALVQMAVQATITSVWLVTAAYSGILADILVPPRDSAATDPLFTLRELRVYLGQALPNWGIMLASWGIFELQLILLTNIRGIPRAGLAAGAVWINIEGALASVQSGWISVAKMRSLKLLGKRDAGAPKAFLLFLLLSFGLTSLVVVPLYLPRPAAALSHILSNDADVARWFARLAFVLAIKSQTRVLQVTLNSLFVPMGLGRLGVALSVTSFVLFAAPLASVAVATDAMSTSVLTKTRLCVGCASMGEAVNALGSAFVLLRLDWARAAAVVHARAQSAGLGGPVQDDIAADDDAARVAAAAAAGNAAAACPCGEAFEGIAPIVLDAREDAAANRTVQ